MSLTTSLRSIFVEEYPSSSPELLQATLENVCKEKDYLSFRKDHFRCECNLDSSALISRIETDGTLKVWFDTFVSTDVCYRCKRSLDPFPNHWIGAGYSELDHYHPQLLLLSKEHSIHLLEQALFCKENKYDTLSNEDFESLVKTTYTYFRHLKKTESDCLFEDVPIPANLSQEIEKTEEEIEALEFEAKSRLLRGAIEYDVTFSV